MSGLALIVAVVTTGLVAGIFLGFSISVMPALARTGDRTFVEVMQRINAAIQNPLFGLVFLGAVVSIGVAGWLHASREEMFSWILAGAVGYGLTLLITFAINIPLNNRLDRAGPAGGLANPRSPRRAFERLWVGAHHVRTLTCVAAFGCLTLALAEL
ncbi:DUF1772 domain-containing protein [Natronosporangium hydrolyticum]|uniref:DUF1772 domain-containing protein n=1 Tax=Natronosporangium hydrolyticum TaxID=2811111 RepID=A0A895YFZ8_9ACTN|nr:anthrone oxygenase family protein [Natronosporangium hydrolyticum]QSB16794.1 DUF1772 domain-containing protein [Natronosporangium hydrolyticum]